MRNQEEWHERGGRLYRVLGRFQANPEGAAQANALFRENRTAHVLEIADGWIVVADKHDEGVAVG